MCTHMLVNDAYNIRVHGTSPLHMHVDLRGRRGLHQGLAVLIGNSLCQCTVFRFRLLLDTCCLLMWVSASTIAFKH
jgi:hypothetical protein